MDARRKIASDASQTDEAFVAAIEEARAQVDAGKTVPFEEVRRWLLSWGTETELPRPKCK
jgi:predicted transcriptional regulator